ncbi:MAG TPA: T9SS type A sorting domain-containing protein [Bacteroidales bacterium]|nr:T9SS type A sorting domain-containing protein [Bacteroidales bacterium]
MISTKKITGKNVISVLTVMLFSSLCFAQGPLSVNPVADPDQICTGEYSQLFAFASGGSGIYTYQWSSNPPGFSSDLPDPIATPYQTTTYYVSVNDGYNYVSGSVTISVFSHPIPDAGPDQAIPHGTSTMLYGSASGGSGNYIYLWEPANKLVNPNVAIPSTVNLTETTLFTLTVTDNSGGCSGADQVVVQVLSSPLSVVIVASEDSVCAHQTVTLEAYVSGGSGNYSFSWTSNPEGFESGNQNLVVEPEVTAWYILEVSDGYNLVTDSVLVFVYEEPVVYSLSGGGTICASDQGIEISLAGSEMNTEYELFRDGIPTGITLTGNGLPLNFGLQNPAGTYTAIGTNTITGCISAMDGEALIRHYHYENPEYICMVNVDTISGKNVVIWEKTPDDGIAGYQVFRETTTGGYEVIGTTGHDEPGMFTDNDAIPLQRSYSYALRAVDTCGNFSGQCESHTTMHLNINTGINAFNLIWTPYTGFYYPSYFIYRRQMPGGFQVLDSVPRSVTSYSDLNPPEGMLDYLIEIRNPDGCDPLAGSRGFGSVFSNVISTNVGVEDYLNAGERFDVFPNPSQGQFTVRSKETIQSLSVCDLTGNTLISFSNDEIKASGQVFNLRNNGPGVYLLRVTIKNRIYYSQIVIIP